MRSSYLLVPILFNVLLTVATSFAPLKSTQSLNIPAETATNPEPRRNKCPAIWTTISSDLTKDFWANRQCTDLARAAIRYAFHDAGTFSLKLPFIAPAAGGAGGSLLLAAEINRTENGGLQQYHEYITEKFMKYDVGAADLIQFAAAHAIVTCPGGPIVQTVVGRTDSSNPSPTGVMPPGFGPGSDHDSLLQLFADKGFDAADLAALIGAQSTSKAFAQQQLRPGSPQDSTRGIWDVKYYEEVYDPPVGIGRFQSGINLSRENTTVGKEFNGFVNNQRKWTNKFANAMFHLSVLDIPPNVASGFSDCTGALPRRTPLQKDIRRAHVNDHAR